MAPGFLDRLGTLLRQSLFNQSKYGRQPLTNLRVGIAFYGKGKPSSPYFFQVSLGLFPLLVIVASQLAEELGFLIHFLPWRPCFRSLVPTQDQAQDGHRQRGSPNHRFLQKIHRLLQPRFG